MKRHQEGVKQHATTARAALLLLCCALAGCLLAITSRDAASAPVRRAVVLREDVTSPRVKSQFLSKFHAAKAHHAG